MTEVIECHSRHAPDGTLVSTLANDPKIGVSVMRVVTGQLTSQAKLSVGMDIREMQVQRTLFLIILF